MTLTKFMARSTWVAHAFEWEKQLKCHLKGKASKKLANGQNIDYSEKRKRPKGFICPCTGVKNHNIQTCLLDSGERLQDHWSSGFKAETKKIFRWNLCFIFPIFCFIWTGCTGTMTLQLGKQDFSITTTMFIHSTFQFCFSVTERDIIREKNPENHISLWTNEKRHSTFLAKDILAVDGPHHKVLDISDILFSLFGRFLSCNFVANLRQYIPRHGAVVVDCCDTVGVGL